MKRFLKLSRDAKLLLIESALLVAAVRGMLWVAPFGVIRRLLERLTSDVAGTRDRQRILNVVDAVRRTARFVPGATCLTQALAALVLLRREGLDAELKIGVAHAPDGDLLAHAWLETDGRIILGKLPGHRGYTVLREGAGARL